MFRLVSLLIGYFIGCIQSAYVVGKIMRVDIRQHGSGNLGTTNALRVLGKKAGVITFVSDILKSVIAFVICYKFYNDPMAGVYASFGAVLGHDFPFYLKFKGGKGIAATIGLIFSLSVIISPWFAVITYGVGILGVVLSNTISLGSILFSISIPIICIVLKLNAEYTVVTILMGILAVYRHKANIERLKNGTENKFLGGKKA